MHPEPSLRRRQRRHEVRPVLDAEVALRHARPRHLSSAEVQIASHRQELVLRKADVLIQVVSVSDPGLLRLTVRPSAEDIPNGLQRILHEALQKPQGMPLRELVPVVDPLKEPRKRLRHRPRLLHDEDVDEDGLPVVQPRGTRVAEALVVQLRNAGAVDLKKVGELHFEELLKLLLHHHHVDVVVPGDEPLVPDGAQKRPEGEHVFDAVRPAEVVEVKELADDGGVVALQFVVGKAGSGHAESGRRVEGQRGFYACPSKTRV